MSLEVWKKISYEVPLTEKYKKAINNILSKRNIGDIFSVNELQLFTDIENNIIENILSLLCNQGCLTKISKKINPNCNELSCKETPLINIDNNEFYCEICESSFEVNDKSLENKDFYEIKKNFIYMESSNCKKQSKDNIFRTDMNPLSGANEKLITKNISSITDDYTREILQTVSTYGLCIVNIKGFEPKGDILKSLAELIGKIRTKQNDYTGLVKPIKPSKKGSANSGDSPSELSFHSDGTQHQQPPALLIFQMENPSDIGGNSYILDFYDILKVEKSEIVKKLISNLSFSNTANFEKKNMFYCGPIFSYNNRYNSLMCRYRFDNVMSNKKKQFSNDFNLLNSMIERATQYNFKMNRGDVVIIDNYRLQHARGPILSDNQRSHNRIWIDDLHSKFVDTYKLGLRVDVELLNSVKKNNVIHYRY